MTAKQKRAIKQGKAFETKNFDLWPALSPGYVYFLKCGEFYKLGHAYNVENRLNSLRCGNPFPIEVVETVKTEDSLFLEDLMHWALSVKHHFREWYRLTKAEADSVQQTLCQMQLL